jgi:hypothetical protein
MEHGEFWCSAAGDLASVVDEISKGIANRIVGRHGGCISAAPGQGTAHLITLGSAQ